MSADRFWMPSDLARLLAALAQVGDVAEWSDERGAGYMLALAAVAEAVGVELIMPRVVVEVSEGVGLLTS